MSQSEDGTKPEDGKKPEGGRKAYAGELLRRFRLRKGLTLEQAARLMATSAPVLSRKERGQDVVERLDIRMAIQVYELDDWESYQLWLAGGYVADSPLYRQRPYSLYEVADLILPHLSYPAFIIDHLAYLRGWNRGIELIWSVSESTSQPINILDDLFTPERRARMGERWHAYMQRAMRIFLIKTEDMTNDPQYVALLERLRARHGALFQQMWNEVNHGAGKAPLTLETTSFTLSHDFAVGHIDFLVTSTTWQFPLPGEITVYVPFGADNQATFLQLAAVEDMSQVYYAGRDEPALGS